jgi:hypothetical protein
VLTKDLPRHYCPECRGHGRTVSSSSGTATECHACSGTGRLTQAQKAKSGKYKPRGAKGEIDAVFIQAALKKKYGKSPWVYLPELRNETAFDSTRTIDGYAIHTGSQKSLLAFEIKISRQDFKRDMASQKYVEWAALCNEFYFVTPTGLLENVDGSLPPGVGLLEVDKHSNIRKVSYPSVNPLNEVPRGLLCVVAKRCADMEGYQ